MPKGDSLKLFVPSEAAPTEVVAARDLLDAARGRHTTSTNPDYALSDLEAYADWMGGRRGEFLVDRTTSGRLRALAHVATYNCGVEINALSVHPDERGKGLGKKVLSAIVDNAIKQDMDAIWLYTHQANTRAKNLFTATGFEELPATDYRQDEDSNYTALELRLSTD